MLPTVPSAIAEIVREMCRPTLKGTPIVGSRPISEAERGTFIAGFSDEKGHRREIDPILLEWLLQRPIDDEKAMLARWWTTVCQSDPQKTTDASTPRGDLSDMLHGSGGLVPKLFDRGIEIWTEAELCALHLLGHLARRDHRFSPRLDRAAMWAMAELQPDNGTNHPWAFHVFARRWCERGEHEARMYAEQLLHNCVVQMGQIDRFSACVLWDSANELERSVNADDRMPKARRG